MPRYLLHSTPEADPSSIRPEPDTLEREVRFAEAGLHAPASISSGHAMCTTMLQTRSEKLDALPGQRPGCLRRLDARHILQLYVDPFVSSTCQAHPCLCSHVCHLCNQPTRSFLPQTHKGLELSPVDRKLQASIGVSS